MNNFPELSVIIPVYNVQSELRTCLESVINQTYRNMEKIQDRITGFIAAHSRASQERLEELMLDTSQLVKDLGTLLEGEEAVKEGLIDEIGGIREALAKLHEMIDAKKNKI